MKKFKTTRKEFEAKYDEKMSMTRAKNNAPDDATAYAAVVFGAGGALLGAGIGALIGSASKTDRWETVPLDEIRVGLSPFASDGVAVSVLLRL